MTRAEIKTAIQALGYGIDTDAAQNSAINDVNRRIHGGKRWPWMESVDTAATIAVGASTLSALPSDLLLYDAIRIGSSTLNEVELEWMEPQALRRLLHLDRTNSTPVNWTRYGSSVYTYPRADAIYAVTLDYVKRHTDLTADGDVPAIPSIYHDLYVWGGATSLAARERDWSAVGFYTAQYKELLKMMAEEYGVKQRQSPRTVEWPSWYRDF